MQALPLIAVALMGAAPQAEASRPEPPSPPEPRQPEPAPAQRAPVEGVYERRGDEAVLLAPLAATRFPERAARGSVPLPRSAAELAADEKRRRRRDKYARQHERAQGREGKP